MTFRFGIMKTNQKSGKHNEVNLLRNNRKIEGETGTFILL